MLRNHRFSTWQMPSSFIVNAAYAQVRCANGNTCRETLNISLADAAAQIVPPVEGWRTQKRRDGLVFAYCGECGEQLLPREKP